MGLAVSRRRELARGRVVVHGMERAAGHLLLLAYLQASAKHLADNGAQVAEQQHCQGQVARAEVIRRHAKLRQFLSRVPGDL